MSFNPGDYYLSKPKREDKNNIPTSIITSFVSNSIPTLQTDTDMKISIYSVGKSIAQTGVAGCRLVGVAARELRARLLRTDQGLETTTPSPFLGQKPVLFSKEYANGDWFTREYGDSFDSIFFELNGGEAQEEVEEEMESEGDEEDEVTKSEDGEEEPGWVKVEHDLTHSQNNQGKCEFVPGGQKKMFLCSSKCDIHGRKKFYKFDNMGDSIWLCETKSCYSPPA